MRIAVAKVGQGRPKSKGCLTSANLLNMNVLRQVIGVLEPESRKIGQGVLTFLRRSRSQTVTYAIYT